MQKAIKYLPFLAFTGFPAFLVFLAALSLLSCNRPDSGANPLQISVSDTSMETEVFEWTCASPESQGMSSEALDELVRDLSERGTKKLMIIRNDKVVCSWFAKGHADSVRRHYSASLAKALVSGMSLLMAMNDSLISPDEPACSYIPQWKNDYVKSMITIRQLAGHTSGMEDAEVSAREADEMIAAGLHTHMDLPGWKGQFWRKDPEPFTVSRDQAPILSKPGQRYSYSNPGIAMLNYAVTSALKDSEIKDIRTYLNERVYGPIGIEPSEVSIGYMRTDTVDGLPLVAGWGGGSFTANAVARVGRLMLRKGNWQGRQLIDSSLVEEALRFEASNNMEFEADRQKADNPFLETTLGWYSNHNGTWKYLPRDAFAGAGAQNQLLLVIPSLDLIVVRFGDRLDPDETARQGSEQFLFNPVLEAITESPYPPSDLIHSVDFAPADSVIRLARGSDNWPVTWAEDDNLYTAYGDGKGFLPYRDIKLSLGIARVSGNPPDISGTNIHTPSGERTGDGKYGPKASGMLMIDGTLYMLVRNRNNSQLVWSDDKGLSWTWADWKFESGLGCPTFLNYGKNYEGARDGFAYIYSHNEESAYAASDEMILVRVPVGELRNRDAYTWYAGSDCAGSDCAGSGCAGSGCAGSDCAGSDCAGSGCAGSGCTRSNHKYQAKWTEDYHKRKPVFVNPGKCYRSGITYNQGLDRYIWCHVIPVSDRGTSRGPRFSGGLGIFEASEPWGPWKTAFYTLDWDMGPGETASIPTKWMSEDGLSCQYLFSGDDCFSVRGLSFNLQ